MPHLRGLPETSPGSSCRCTWIGPRYSPSSSSLCPAGEAERVRRGARPAPRPPPALAGPHRAHRHLARAARLSGGTAPVPFDPAPHASAAPAVRLRGAARRALLGNIWRRLWLGPANMAAAAAALAWLAAACLLLAAQVRAAPVPLVPPGAVTQPLGTLPRAGPARPGLGAASGTRVPARAALGPGAPP